MRLFESSTKKELEDEMELFLSIPDKYSQFIYISENNEPVALVEGAIRTDYVNGTKVSPVVFLEGIYVQPDFRLQGIAKKLTDKIIEWGSSKGIKEMASDALLNNLDSHATHKALGFQETERVVYFKREI
jgi:aminoglycoside 6'-N-acetyltransferase I